MTNRFSEAEQQFIRDNAKGIDSEQLTQMLNKKFNTNYSRYKVYRYKKRHDIKSGVDTKFKKGQKAHNHKPVGSEILKKEGYVMIKVAEPNTWKCKTTYIYEQAHGKIPKGYHVVFADRDKTNFNLDNLILVRNKDLLTAKNRHLLFEDKELTSTGLLIAKLINETHERSKDASKS